MSSPAARVQRATAPRLGSSSRLYRDGTSLASSSMLTALLGVAFWIIAARTLPPSKLGVQTALLSALTAPAIVIASGVGDAFTAILPAAAPAATHSDRTPLPGGLPAVVVVLAVVTVGGAAAGHVGLLRARRTPAA